MNITADCRLITAWPEGTAAGARRIGVLAKTPQGENIIGYIEANEASDALRQAFATMWQLGGEFTEAVGQLMFPSATTRPEYRQRIISKGTPLPPPVFQTQTKNENTQSPQTPPVFSLKA